MESETYREPTRTGETYDEPTGWVGWIFFAAVLMILAGIMNAIHGFIALVNDEWVVWSNRGDLYLDLTTWGWLHLIVGIVVFLAGIGLLSGNVLARAIAVIVASVGIIANFLFIPAFPVWALTVITINVFVIYALTAHGRELRRV
ncbi:MAG TPA: hypothetical protein VFH36_14295 [Acidimicrobiales bacterium]|jgi:hypothetical protein|nr:hypothetical protein [Acidimicrobiales bacterium]